MFTGTATLIDAAMPNDRNIKVNKLETIEKYQDERLWNIKAEVKYQEQ